MRLILICTSFGASGHPHGVLRVLYGEHRRLAYLVVDRVRRVDRLGHRQARRGARRHERFERDRDHGGEQRRDGGRDGDEAPVRVDAERRGRCVDGRDDQPRGDDRRRYSLSLSCI